MFDAINIELPSSLAHYSEEILIGAAMPVLFAPFRGVPGGRNLRILPGFFYRLIEAVENGKEVLKSISEAENQK